MESNTQVRPFLSAAQAIPFILEAVPTMQAVGIQDVDATVERKTDHHWIIKVEFKAPRWSALNGLWTSKTMDEFSFHITGQSGENDEGFVANAGLNYSIWSVLFCEYLWSGDSFNNCMEAMSTIS